MLEGADCSIAIQELTPELVDTTASMFSEIHASFAGISTFTMTLALCRHAANHEDPLVLVAVREGAAVGAIMATLEPGRFWRRFLLPRPLLLAHLVWHRKRPAFGGPGSEASSGTRSDDALPSSLNVAGADIPLAKSEIELWNNPPPNTAKILYIGVRGDQRRGGVGGRLYRRFFEAAARRGMQRICARVDYDNTASLRLHHRTGWRLYRAPGSALAILPITADNAGGTSGAELGPMERRA